MSAASALLKKEFCHFVNTGRILRSQSRFKVVFILIFATLLETGLWKTFLYGFRFLDQTGGIAGLIISRLFSLFFLAMSTMLVASGAVTSYSTMYRSPEIPFLLTKPFCMSTIGLHKFYESTGFSSWAFFLVVIPFVGAFASYQHISPFFALWTLLFSFPFLYLCSGIGTTITMLVVRFLPVTRLIRFLLVLSVTTMAVVAWWSSRTFFAQTTSVEFNLARLIPGVRLASHPLMPSWWISEGIQSLNRHLWSRGFMFFALLLTSAIVISMCVEALAASTFYTAWQKVHGQGNSCKRNASLLPILNKLTAFMHCTSRAMIKKDIRTFLRDPMQWSQALIFFGLLAIYFSNLRSVRSNLPTPAWRNTVAFLNVFSVSSVMCSLASRFVYPQLSLEGQGYWLLGLSPVTPRRIVLTKFFVSLFSMMLVSTSLMLLSSTLLGANSATCFAAISLACSISFAVSGLSVGLGALFLDLSHRSPAAIVSGFGGTLNLVLCLIFMLTTIVPFGLLYHLQLNYQIQHAQFLTLLAAATAWTIVITSFATILPLYLGIRALRNRDF